LPESVKRLLRLISAVPCLLALGIALRTYHYARNPSMWHDEAMLVLNVLDKDIPALWGKLDFAEAAPPLFLCLERLVVLTLGDSTFALRLVPFLSSCMALVGFARIAPRILSPRAVPWAVMLFACSDHLLWHTCEAKPYSTDVLTAVLLLYLFVATSAWSAARRALAFAAAAPVVVWLSYPGIFLIGGVLTALLPSCVRRRQRWQSKLAYLVLAIIAGVSFALLVLGPVRLQRCPEMDACWAGCFAQLDRPATLPFWVIYNTAQICRYCCEPAGNVLTIPAVIGAFLMWRRRRSLLTLLLIPCGLALTASFFHAYPYTAARVLVYTTPAWALLIAEGAAWVGRVVAPSALTGTWAWPPVRYTANIVGAVLVVQLLLSPCYAMIHVFMPQARTDCGAAAEFVLEEIRQNELVTSNAPESRYYLRGAEAFVAPEALHAAVMQHIWLVGTGRTEKERLACMQSLPPGDWRVIRQRDFQLTTVYRLERDP